ncbi:Rix1 complex component [Pseudoneurospora amorphoporcata]|uniref:Pre-rRNA-processing protein n=1 Tax=Pseudoneurospora amorphoporcata TaxID=241081 RepID=A0AAN6SFN7_9PEZI|nr:Rix1 complex component [Pseudoneurospora amorphoporcata]
MGSSDKKKREKKKDFNKAKLKVGKAKAKAANFTDTSFKSKSIVVNQHTLAALDGVDLVGLFKQHLNQAINSKSDKLRQEALVQLTKDLSSKPIFNPVGVPNLLTKLLPLITDSVANVRTNFLKLLRALPPSDVAPHVEKILMYIRGGMTHLSTDIRSDTLSVLDWLIEVCPDETVSCPGGWLKTLNSFSSMLGWNPSVASTLSVKGWTSATKTSLNKVSKKNGEAQAKQITILAKFLEAGFRPETPLPYDEQRYWDSIYRMPTIPNPFAYLNLWGAQRDEDGEMYPDRISRQQVFERKWRAAIKTGVMGAKQEGGVIGRAASVLDKVLRTAAAEEEGAKKFVEEQEQDRVEEVEVVEA